MKRKPAKKIRVVKEGLPDDGSSSSSHPVFRGEATGNRALKVATQALLVVSIMMALVWGRVYYFQQKYFREGETYRREGNLKEAVTGYEWTIRMYTPFSGKVNHACQMLWDIGLEYEKRGQLDWALITSRSLRSSLLAIRSFYSPYKEWLPQVDAKIKEILKIQKMKDGTAEAADTNGK